MIGFLASRSVGKSKKAVLAATYQLLTKSGLGGVSVDEVARLSGVAKTTIYRHWPPRESLLLDACSQLSSRPPVPDTGRLLTDLETLASGAAVRLQQPCSTVMPSIIDAAERDKDLAELQSRIHTQMRGAFRGRDRAGSGTRGTVSIPRYARVGGFDSRADLYRRFFSRERLDEAFSKQVVNRTLRNTE